MVDAILSTVIERSCLLSEAERVVPKEQRVAFSALDEQASLLRKPVQESFFDKVLRFFRNHFCTTEWCQYRDVQINLAYIEKTLQSQSELTYEIKDLREERYITTICHGDAKEALSAYTTRLQEAIGQLSVRKQESLREKIATVNQLAMQKNLKPEQASQIRECFSDLDKLLQGPTNARGRLQEVKQRAQKIAGYDGSPLAKKIDDAEKIVQLIDKKWSDPRDVLAAFEQLDAKEWPQLGAVFVEKYKEALSEYQKSALRRIEAKSEQVTDLARDLQAPLFEAANALEASQFAKPFIKELQPVFQKVCTSIGNTLYSSEQLFNEMVDELRELRRQIPSLSVQELAERAHDLEGILAMLEESSRQSDDLVSRFTGDKPFMQEFISQLKQHQASYVRQLKETLAEMRKVEGVAPAVQDIVRSKGSLQIAGKTRSVKQLATGALKVLASTVGWATGTHYFVEKACSINSYAHKVLGATGAFALFATLGYTLQNCSTLGALLFAGVGVALSATVSESQRELHTRLPKTNKCISLSVGLLTMATYAYCGPGVARWLTSSATPTTVEQAEQHLRGNLTQLEGSVKNAIQDGQKVQFSLDVLQQDAVALNGTVTNTTQHVQLFSEHVGEARLSVNAFNEVAAGTQSHVEALGQTAGQLQAEVAKFQGGMLADTCPTVEALNVEPIQNLANQLAGEANVVAQDAVRLNSTLTEVLHDKGLLEQDVTRLAFDNQQLASEVGNLRLHNTELQGNVTQLARDVQVCETQLDSTQTAFTQYQAALNPSRSWWQFGKDIVIGGTMVVGGGVAAVTGVGAVPGVGASALGISKMLGTW